MMDFEEEFDEEFESDASFEMIKEFMDQIPEDKTLLLNFKRYSEMKKSVSEIIFLLEDEFPEAIVKLEYDKITGQSVLFFIECSSVTIENCDRFSKAIALANSIDVFPLTNGNVRIGICYEGVRTLLD